MPGVLPRRLGSVDVHALWAVEFDHCLPGDIRQTNGQHWLVLTIHTGTVAKVPSLVLLNHLGNASVCQNVSRITKFVTSSCPI